MIENLKYLRQKNGMSQKQLAECIGVSQQSVNKYENHAVEPDITTLKRMAEVFDTSVDFLIGHTEVERKIESVEAHDLNRREAELIALWRALSESERESLLFVARNYRTKK